MMDIKTVTRKSNNFKCHFSDTNIYNTIEFENGLIAVLISTTANKIENASISLSIETGSFNDSQNFQGLAHLLSNLIIRESIFENKKLTKFNNRIITRKLAKEIKTDLDYLHDTNKKKRISLNDYLQSIKGTIKFITEFEYTTFELKVPDSELSDTLEKFYSCFEDNPTLSEFLIQDTIKLMQDDYFINLKKKSMMRLKLMICKLAENTKLQNYPSNAFLNISSENKIKHLRDSLIKFFKKYYIPRKMKLIIRSNQSVEFLNEQLDKTFSNLINCSKSTKKKFKKTFHIKNVFYNDQLINKINYITVSDNFLDEKTIFFNKPKYESFNLDSFDERNNLFDLKKDLNCILLENNLGKKISNEITFGDNFSLFNFSTSTDFETCSLVENSDQLCFTWNIDYKHTYYPLMPLNFISSLICKQGSGTLINFLKEKYLITSIKAGNLPDCNFANNSLWNLFFIKIYLTNEGLKEIKFITIALMSYLNKLCQTKNLDRAFNEYSKLTFFEYYFKEIRSKSMHDLFTTVKKMHLFPLEDLFVANKIPLSQNPISLILALLKQFKFKNCSIIILTNQNQFDEIKASPESFHGIEIKQIQIDVSWCEISNIFEKINLTKENIFITNDMKIKYERENFDYPKIIYEREDVRVWFKKDSVHLLPLTSAKLLISTKYIKKNIINSLVCDLILLNSEYILHDTLFQIREASFLYKVDYNKFGFVVSVSGSSDKLINVFEKIVGAFKSEIKENQFEEFKKEMSIKYKKINKLKFKLFLDLQSSLLNSNYWNIEEKKNFLDKLNLKDVNNFVQQLFKNSFREYLIQGNHTLKDAHLFYNQLEKLFELNQNLILNSSDLIEILPKFNHFHFYCSITFKKQSSYIKPETDLEDSNSLFLNQDFNHSNLYKLTSTAIKSKIPRLRNNISYGLSLSRSDKTKSHKNTICSDFTNNNSFANTDINETNLSNIINNESQLVCNLYFTKFDDCEMKHICLLKIFVYLIKKYMNDFFSNKNNILDQYLSPKWLDKVADNAITYIDYKIFMEGQIDCCEFELNNSKGFLFIISDKSLLLPLSELEKLIEKFLTDYLIDKIIDLDDTSFNNILNDVFKSKNSELSLLQETNFNWNEIITSKRRFNYNKLQKNILNTQINRNLFERRLRAYLSFLSYFCKLSLQIDCNENSNNLLCSFDDEFTETEIYFKDVNDKSADCWEFAKSYVIKNIEEFKNKILNNEFDEKNNFIKIKN